MTRRTTMLFTIYPPTTHIKGWKDYVHRFQQDITFILWCRVVRKTPRERIVGDVDIITRQLEPKWHDKSGVTGVIEATAVWEERDETDSSVQLHPRGTEEHPTR
jgi:hypothetical protein